MLALRKEGIPDELKKDKRWVAFNINHEGKKIPIDPKVEFAYRVASISDPETWGTFEQAASLAENGLYPAVAYAKPKGDNLLFNDLDGHLEKCKSEEEKIDLIKKYEALLRQLGYFDTYMEQSISGTGVHLLARGSLNPELATGSSPTMPLEIYGPEDARFIIMTGHRLNDFDISNEERTVGAIQNLHKHYFPPKTKTSNYEPASSSSPYSGNGVSPAQPVIPSIEEPIRSDEEVIRLLLRDKKAELLWNGNWEQVTDENGNQKYTQQHYSDMVLMRKICFYSGNCPTQMDRVFRLSPCFQQYGKDGKWTKYESDIKKDIHTTSTTCLAVYAPDYHKNDMGVAKTNQNQMVQANMGIPLVNPLEWKPDYCQIEKWLYGKEECPFNNPVLKNILRDYIDKYSGQSIAYYPMLFKEDRNINGATNIVQRILGENFKYSYQFGDYFIWNGKQYKASEDPEILIHPITVALGLVEHSVFEWVINYVAPFQNPEPTDNGTDTEGSQSAKLTPKDYLEQKAIKLFEYSKKFVSRSLAQDVLKKYKGMSIGDDIVTYYETPYINMQNGMFNMITREFTPFHDPDCNLYKITNCDYDPNADCPEFRAMMERLIPDPAERKELQKAFGLCLAKEQLPAKKIFVMLIGPKDSGKSFLLNTLVDTLGDYAISVDNSLLMQTGRDTTKGPEMYDFKDNLMITASETDDTKDKINTNRLKGLSGDTTQSIRNLFSKKMDKFRMIGIIFVDSNAKPFLDPRDTAAHDRLRLFQLPNPVKVKDITLKSKLVAERPGIFNWLLEGLDMVLEEKEIFETPDMITRKKEYKDNMDTTSQFITDCLIKTEVATDKIPTSGLYSTYKNWCTDNKYNTSVRNKFYEEIGKSFEKKKSGVEQFINMKYSDLGFLYSRMQEKAPAQFAKEKRILLEGSDTPSYSTLKDSYFGRSWGWFVANIDHSTFSPVQLEKYDNYCEWCIEHGLVPIKKADFSVKVKWLCENMQTMKPDAAALDGVKDIWN